MWINSFVPHSTPTREGLHDSIFTEEDAEAHRGQATLQRDVARK